MHKNAVTIIEVLMVIIIIAILASLCVPIYTKRIENTRHERLIANTEIMRDSYRANLIKNPNLNFNATNLIQINTNLDLELSDPWFTYNPANATNTSLSLNATRVGKTTNNTIIYTYNAINSNENWAGNWAP